jgi:adenylate kinase family enzyme
LQCSGETILQRISANVGGDRSGRADDDVEAIRNKLTIFNRRTAPLLEHYRQQQARIETIEVTAAMSPQQMWEILHQR